jgi:hypothetical protein
MAEKKGFTGKLKYDFPEQKLLEVHLETLEVLMVIEESPQME